MNGEQATAMWNSALLAIKLGDLELAETIASRMHIPSDAKLIRAKIGALAEHDRKVSPVAGSKAMASGSDQSA